ncbi:S24/S26 family peptidase [Gordonia sp. GN26]
MVATVLALILGLRPMIFETGSMTPTIPTGSLGLGHSVPATSVRPGDVVSIVRDDGIRVTHRAETVSTPTGNSVTFTLRGDANNIADPRSYTVTEVQRVVGTVPFLGYVAAWLKNPYTLALEALAALFLLTVAFAPKQGWRHSPAGQRILAGTAAATVVALGVSQVHGPGNARAALTDQVTAVGSVSLARPPIDWFRCQNTTIGLLANTITISWPNPPVNQQAGYIYRLSFPDLPLVNILPLLANLGISLTWEADETTANPITYTFPSALVTGLTTLLSTLLMQDTRVVLRVYKGDFSSQPLTHNFSATLLSGARCDSPGYIYATSGAAARRAAPESLTTEPSESTEAESSESAASDESTNESAELDASTPAGESADDDSSTPTSTKVDLPSGGTLSDAGDYAYYESGGKVTIRSAETGDREYEGRFSSSSEIRWLPGTSTLEITEPDGTVTTVERDGNRWTETVVEPAAAGAKAPTEDNDAPSDSAPTPAATSVPSADDPAES